MSAVNEKAHDFTALSATEIQSVLSDPSERVRARMDWKVVQRFGAHPLTVLVLTSILTTVGVATAAQLPDASTADLTAIRGVLHAGTRPMSDIEVRPNKGVCRGSTVVLDTSAEDDSGVLGEVIADWTATGRDCRTRQRSESR